jgi:cytochrome c oxidase cbb3-type subunit 3
MRLFYRLSLIAVVGTIMGALPTLAQAAAKADGKAVYSSKCALCHGKDGAPLPAFAKKNAPDFGDAGWQKRRTDAQIKKGIADGNPGTMMRAFKKSLSPAEIDALTAYIRALGTKGAK